VTRNIIVIIKLCTKRWKGKSKKQKTGRTHCRWSFKSHNCEESVLLTMSAFRKTLLNI